MTPTTQYADVVLPAASFLEKESVRSWWIPLQTINKAISVEGCRPDVEINFELARRFDPNLKWETVHELFDDILKPSGMTFEELQRKAGRSPPRAIRSALPSARKGTAAPRRETRVRDPYGKSRTLFGATRELGF